MDLPETGDLVGRRVPSTNNLKHGTFSPNPRRSALISVPTTLFFLLTLLHSVSSSQFLDSLAIEVKGPSREFSFTNKESAFYYGETNAENTTSWQGFNVFGHEFLNDYAIYVYGKKLERDWIVETFVYPDRLKRIYKNGIVEELHIADSIAAFAVTITSERAPITVELVPDFGASAQELVVRGSAVARASHLERTPDQNYPVWIAVGGDLSGFDTRLSGVDNQTFPLVVRGSKRDPKHTFTFAVDDGTDETATLARVYAQRLDEFNTRRRERMETLLRQTHVETDDKRFNKALAWAKLSLDALMMNQITKGIFAGLPWFNNYWGRDTFISLPGATLVTGRFAEAKEILRSFAAFQQSDSASTDYGRIPNIVTTTDKAYNTADGTPRFVMMAKEYVVRSGDSSFIEEVYPVVRRSIDGTLKYHTDSLGFLTHGDAETWMDAVGPDGPWSPRGNRANDIQALWIRQLEAGVWFALKTNDAASARSWQAALDKCRASFSSHFITGNQNMVFDHLRRDGTPDTRIRPNQIFASGLLPDSVRAAVLKNVVSNLSYEYGVASLPQNDPDFHPYHQYEPNYPKDAAYHNGTVWTWVQGEVISELCRFGRQDLAAHITQNTVHQILDRGAVGTQSELLDAIARPGEMDPRLSGTFSQAWNLAEFIRNFYDDYLGVEVRRYEHVLLIRPRLPKSFGKVKARINLGGKSMMVEIVPKAGGTDVTINSHDATRPGLAVVTLPAKLGELVRTSFQLLPKSDMTLELRKTAVALSRNGSPHKFTRQIVPSLDGGKTLASLRLATPRLNPKLKALKGPDYPTITHSVLKFANPEARVLVDVADPAMDDTGTVGSRYVYPKTPHVIPGSFDITWFTVSYDATNA
ncbi:MAG TPA: amylo-alpha-1,6-glucosidase, partial [Bacteroidota bacterium]|nr:amylo-alpha-1,6-glucosidase [Bacteroidota bacterium]